MFGRIFVRRLTSLAEPLPQATKGRYPYPNSSRYRKLMERQSRFCTEDGKLVWQKLPADMLLYRITIGLVSVGTLLTLDSIRRLATPPKND